MATALPDHGEERLRRKNVLSVLMQCFMSMCPITLVWVKGYRSHKEAGSLLRRISTVRR